MCLGRCQCDSVALLMWGEHELSLICFPQRGAFWVPVQLSMPCQMLYLHACQ